MSYWRTAAGLAVIALVGALGTYLYLASRIVRELLGVSSPTDVVFVLLLCGAAVTLALSFLVGPRDKVFHGVIALVAALGAIMLLTIMVTFDVTI